MPRESDNSTNDLVPISVSSYRALLALINVVKPGTAHVPDDSDPTRALTNCSQAMRLAEAHLKVPRIIEPEHLASGHIDELSMITYLSYFVEPAQAKLKKWVKRALPHASITNFTSNWFDGVHFLALMNICFPGSLPKFTKMTKQDANQNVSVFYETCKTKLRFEPHYSNEDLVAGKVDELQVMTTILQVQNGKLQSMPEAVVVSGNGLDIAKIGKDNTFTISTMEAGPGKLNVEAYYEDGRKLKFKLKEKVGGVLTLSYMPPTQGRLIFDVQWSDVPVPNSPFTVLALNPSMIHILDFDNHAKVRDAGKEVEVKLEMKQATKVSNISAHLSYSKGHRVEAKVTEAEGSTAILKFTPVLAGNATLQVFLNKRELSHLSVSYTIVDSGGYQIESLPKKSTYETFEEVEFTITSMKKLSLNVLQMTAVLTDDIQFPFSFKSIQGSLGLASFKPTLAGEYKVEVTCAEIAIQGSPFSVNVVDPMECKLSSTIPSHMELNKPYIFELETNAKNLDYIKFEVIGKDGSIFNVDYVHREENSIALLKVTAVAEGSFMVGVKLQDQWVPGCPFQLTVCNPSKFQISRDLQDRKSAVVGEAVHISIESMEVGAFESKLLPVVTASGPTAKYSPKHHLREDRQALIFQFTPYEIGMHEVSILYGGFPVPSSPIFINVVAYNSHTFSASGSGLQEAYTNVPGQFMILTKRTGLLENKILQVKVAGVVNGKECSIDVKDNRNGSYYVEYLITNPGAYLITVLAGGTHIPGSPFKLTALPGPNPHRCKMSGPALNESEVFTLGQSIDFTVDVTKGGTGKLVTKATGPEGVTARVFVAKNSMSKGIHDIKIDPVHHGRYEVSVKWSGTDIPGSPFIINVFPGVDASKCRAYGRGLENGRVGSLAEFYIETHNAGSGNLYVGIHSVQDTCKIVMKPKDMKDVRTQVARYFPRKPGNFIISVTWSDKHIPGSPFKVKITGEAMEDNFKPNKYKPPTRNDELESITEEAEEGDDDLFDIDFDISSVVSRTRESQHSLSQKVPSVKSLDEIGMPSFQRTGIDRGFQQTFTKSDQLMSKSLTHISKGSTATSKPKRKVVAKRKVKRKAAATAKANGPKSGSLK